MKSPNYILFVLFLLVQCSDENPTITETGYGKIIIESNVENAEIYVGGVFSGLVTPDTLELLAVKHKIKVRKSGYFSEEDEISITKNQIKHRSFELLKNTLPRIILLESFIYSDCESCLHDYEIVENLVLKYGKNIQAINYPTWQSDNHNLFYLDAKEAVDIRLDQYNIIDSPKFIVNGTIYDNLESGINEELMEFTQFAITVKDSIIQGGEMIINVNIDVYDLDGLNFGNLFLYTVILEQILIESSIAGSGINTNMLREIIPTNGISLSGINKKGRARFAVSKILNPRWKKENLSVVAFIYNIQSKEIFQVGVATDIKH